METLPSPTVRGLQPLKSKTFKFTLTSKTYGDVHKPVLDFPRTKKGLTVI